MVDILQNDAHTLKNMRFVEIPYRPCYNRKRARLGVIPYRLDKREFLDCAYNVMCKDVSGWNRWGEHTAEYCQNCKFYGGLVFGGQVRCLYKEEL